MTLITLQDCAYGHGSELLLDGIQLSIESDERVCLIGRNGAGKSTLMRILLGELELDRGQTIRKQNLKVAFLPQSVPDDLGGTVYDNVAMGLGELGKALIQADHVAHLVEQDPSEKNLKSLERLHARMEENDGWNLDRKIRQLLERMELDPEAEVSGFSAGLKRRVLLGRAVIASPELLMLDEPTNHLDIPSIQWLEEFLLKFEGSLLFVSHDRHFLRRLSTRTLVVERARCLTFTGTYDVAMEKWSEFLRIKEDEEKLFDKRLADEEIWIRQGIKARRTRNEGRVRSLEKMRDERQQRRQKLGQVQFKSQDAEKSGRKVIEAKGIGRAWDNKYLFKDFNILIERGDKVALVGANGCGKTTLLRILLNQLPATEGEVIHGTNLQISFFDQLHASLDLSKTVKDNLSDGSDWVDIGERRQHVLGYLQNFLFTPERARMPVRHLSGGERNRLQLAKMFSKAGNVLVLDEPTNDLDIETLDLLVEMLIDFEGTVLLVSHDRDFVDRVATTTIAFEEAGPTEYFGGYQDYIRQRQTLSQALPKTNSETKEVQVKPIVKLTEVERKELFNLPKLIEKNEAEQAKLHLKMAEEGFYQQAPDVIEKTTLRIKKLEEDGKKLLNRWESLENRS
jgi:ABC transport system ATP-binding/permease protein